LYWTDTIQKTINRAVKNGSGTPEIVAVLPTPPLQIALNYASDHIYFSEAWDTFTIGRIQRTHMDGSHLEDIIKLGAYSLPESFALDIVHREIYWSDPGVKPQNQISRIQRANLDIGVNTETLLEAKGESPRGIAVDPGYSQVFYADSQLQDIFVTDLLFSSAPQKLNATGLVNPQGVAIDDSNHGYVYWSDIDTHSIWRIKRDGTAQELLLDDTSTNLPYSIFLDQDNNMLYFANAGTNPPEIARIDLSNPIVPTTSSSTLLQISEILMFVALIIMLLF